MHVAETKNTHVNDVTMYEIYNITHSKSVYMANDTTLDLGHRKFAIDIALAFGSGYIYCKLPLTSVSGSICYDIDRPLHGFVYSQLYSA